jgi:hypothetical protein
VARNNTNRQERIAMRRPPVVPGPLARQFAGRLAGLVAAAALLAVAVAPAAFAAQDEEPEAPVGVFGVTIGRGDVPSDLAGGPGLIGQWRVEFAADGSYTMSRLDVGEVVRGSYEVDGATVTILDEGGLLACGGGPEGETAEATYAWELEGESLTLTPIEEGCDARRLLLGTRTLGGFALCETQPLAAGRDDDPDATPSPDDADRPAIPNLQPSTSGRQDPGDAAAVEAAIDELLLQVTGCWATGDPERFLPLHSEQVLEDIAALGPPAQFNTQLAQFMATPLTFERVGDVELADPTHASAFVVLNFGEEEVPLEFQFVFEDGRWLLDTFFLFELIA